MVDIWVWLESLPSYVVPLFLDADIVHCRASNFCEPSNLRSHTRYVSS